MITHICFHGIGTCTKEREPGEARYWMAEETFFRVLDAVVDEPNVRLSFDDGNRSDVDVALPALEDRGMDATFFALAGRLDDAASLSATDLKDLRARGMRIGNHGWSHAPWRRLSDDDAQRELVDARRALEEAAEVRITEAAFPLGRYDRRLLAQLRPLNYTTVYSSDRFPARRSAWLQARYSVTSEDTAESVRAIVLRPPGLHEARNLLASGVKRVR